MIHVLGRFRVVWDKLYSDVCGRWLRRDFRDKIDPEAVPRVVQHIVGQSIPKAVDEVEYVPPDRCEVEPQRWTGDRLGAVVDVVDVLDAKVHAMEAHQTQAPDLAMWAAARAKLPEIFREETFIREYPEPGGPPLETDLFAALRAQQPAEMTRAN